MTLFVGLAIAGCGGGESGPVLVPFKGKVVMDGQPLEGATVTLVPTGGAGRNAASGVTDSEGVFEPFTVAAPGVEPGEYRVTVSKLVKSDAAADAPPIGEEEDIEQLRMQGLVKESVAEKFTNPETSGLSVTVEAGSNEMPTFEVTAE